jgi:protein-disulfide isomerase
MNTFKIPFIILTAVFIAYLAISINPTIKSFQNPDKDNYAEINGKKYYINDIKEYQGFKKAHKEYINNLGNVFQNFAMEEVLRLEAKEKNLSVEELLARTKREPSSEEIEAVYLEFKERLQGMSLVEARQRIIEYLNAMNEQEFRKNLIQKYAVFISTEKAEKAIVEVKGNPSLGPNDAKITIIEFSDFECPYCQRSQSVTKSLRAKYKDQIKWVFRDFPLSFHQNAMFAHIAANCVGKQGKYWDIFDKLFQNTGSLNREKVLQLVSDMNIDMKKFEECTKDPEVEREVHSDIADGQEVGVNGTPAFFINGIMIEGAQPITSFEKIIEQELK